MLQRRLMHRVDQRQRPPRILVLVKLRLHPDGEELRAQLALLRGLKVHIAAIQRIGQVVVLIQHALRRVGMRIDKKIGRVRGICHGLGCMAVRLWARLCEKKGGALRGETGGDHEESGCRQLHGIRV